MNFQYINKYCIHWNNSAEQIISRPNETNFNSLSCNLTIGLYPREMVQSPNDPNLSYICHAYNEMIKMIYKYLKCRIGFQVITEINYYWPNGTFKGALGLMWEDKIDFVPYPHAVTEERLKILKLDNVVAIDDKISILSFPRFGNNENVKKTQVGKTMIETFGLLVALGTVKLSTQPKRIISNPLIYWIFFSFFIKQFFSSDITSLILSKTELKFDTLDQLVEHKDYGILVKESFQIDQYANFSSFPYSSIIKRLIVIPHSNFFSFDTIERLIYEKNIVILPKGYVKMIANFYPNYKLHVSQESYFSTLVTFPLRKIIIQCLD
ncbi:hypothetical protein BLOT_008083 [Blomia tropicalis]|nr:hypothetical protein BLOT_008083 [Blomia tropicalis]